MTRTQFGPWTQVQTRRESHGLRKAELADMAGISQAYMSMLEAGHRWPSVPVTVKLARALGVSPASITRRKERTTCPKPLKIASLSPSPSASST